MRQKLKDKIEERISVYGEFVKTGWKTGYKTDLQTILLKNIKNSADEILTDHIWLNLTKGFSKLELAAGDIVAFEARVKKYQKGYKGRDYTLQKEKPINFDYKFSHPTKIKKINPV